MTAGYFDETPISLVETIAPARSNAVLGTLLEFSNALASARDASAIRERLLSFVFAISPADRAAVLLVDREGLQFDSIAGRDRRDAAKPVWVSRTIVERVYNAYIRMERRWYPTIWRPQEWIGSRV